ncbi:sigma-70 family RNA polymerase sigma factor [Streptomonospora nanhaiensis]|uniref:sigma-70 family RNA polymerase sigma factor n=1 Tax=Streptomonospora nanhaiensis TaxID=1323731 RepID=UPI001C98E655|nr:sigma-70 family RNA polymerase sigma factor [Streptomonospora nanhaiensis]MBX9389270.1 sigma-70 family RNA polymerase sigma factor [Streptomonospora nanhaiensis]
MSELTAESGRQVPAQGSAELADQLEGFRVELTGYCYRMLGSAFEAEDAVQEAMVRAWRAYDRFEHRSSLRSWLYRIATNTCLDALKGRERRARPVDMGPAGGSEPVLGPALGEDVWVEPFPDERALPGSGDPAEEVALRDSVRLAFVAALQHLAPRQRAVLILREVLAWRAAEVAELLGTSVASVNSALQRARATLAAAGDLGGTEPLRPGDGAQQELLRRYVAAFESYDLEALTAVLREDATLSMPPYALWLRGAPDICAWMLGPGHGCRGSRLVPVAANGTAAFGQYRPVPGRGFEPWALQVIEVRGGRISALNSFLDTERLFPLFGLPAELAAAR